MTMRQEPIVNNGCQKIKKCGGENTAAFFKENTSPYTEAFNGLGLKITCGPSCSPAF